MPFPPPVTASLREPGVREYWLARARQHTGDWYAGVPLSKFPEDLRTYEHLLWSDAPDTVIEIGTQAGGSALWFRDRLRTLAEYGTRFVPPDGYFVVEDGCVDVEEMRASDDWPRGVLPALHDWLRTAMGSEFQVRRDLELYGISCHPQGFLQRLRAGDRI